MVKIITQCRPIAVRSIGRPRLRLEDDVREGMGSMKNQNWSKMDIDREAWKRTVWQAKTHIDLQHQNVQTNPGSHSGSNSMSTGVFPQGRQG